MVRLYFYALFRGEKYNVYLFCFVNRTVTSGGKPGREKVSTRHRTVTSGGKPGREKVSTRPVKVRLTLTKMSCGGVKVWYNYIINL